MSERLDNLKSLIKDFPQTPGVYLMKNSRDKIIYVGKAKNLRSRVRSYFTKSKDHALKTQYLVAQIHHIDYMLTKTEVEAFLLEASLIKKHKPRYNIRLKDDKAYPYICCTIKHDFPRFYLQRKVKSDGSLYFGPYTSGGAVRGTIRFINRTFKIRDCTDSYMKNRKRACMTHQIGRCTAPCVDMIDQKEYGQDIKQALNFLKGENKSLIKDLTGKMKNASNEERFEAAAKFRDSIRAIEQIWEKQSVISMKMDRDQDIVGYYGDKRGTLIETLHIRRGRVIGNRSHFLPKLDTTDEKEDPKEWLTSFLNQYYMDNIIPDEILISVDLGGDILKLLSHVFNERQSIKPNIIHSLDQDGRKLMDMAEANAKSHFEDHMSKRENRLKGLDEIQSKLKLPESPQRIECFDISNFQGKDSVASQVVFEDGVPKKEDYRRYKIKTVEGSNDFASMKEVLSRRLAHTEYDDPQLIVIDGGKGQLKMAVEVLMEIGRPEIPVVGMAKARTLGEFKDKEVRGSEERFFLPGRQNPVTFRKGAEALSILVNIRDEAHRFAISYHRKLRNQTMFTSQLDNITGLGKRRIRSLLKAFPSVDDIRAAEVDEIAKVQGFSTQLAFQVKAGLERMDDLNSSEENEESK